MLLSFENKLRIVVGSGNISSGDWMFWSNCYVKMDFAKRCKYKKKKETIENEMVLKKRNDFGNLKDNLVISSKYKFKKIKDLSTSFSFKVKKYLKKLKRVGYTFKIYLKQYLEFTMEERISQLKEFLNLDLDEYNLEQNELFLVGSLPGGYQNLIHYSSPEIIQLGKL